MSKWRHFKLIVACFLAVGLSACGAEGDTHLPLPPFLPGIHHPPTTVIETDSFNQYIVSKIIDYVVPVDELVGAE